MWLYKHGILVSRDYSGYGLNQWETMLQCDVVSYWLSPYSKRSLVITGHDRSIYDRRGIFIGNSWLCATPCVWHILVSIKADKLRHSIEKARYEQKNDHQLLKYRVNIHSSHIRGKCTVQFDMPPSHKSVPFIFFNNIKHLTAEMFWPTHWQM